MLLGIGSLVCDSADSLPLLLIGRAIQGLGAGGLTVQSYALYGDLEASDPGKGLNFLTAMSLCIAAGTICGPFVGAALNHGQNWVIISHEI